MNQSLTISELKQYIHSIRGKAVIIDSDLAALYQVETKRLNEAVKRNIKRFPIDFMFQLTEEEFEVLRSQFATSNYGGRRYLPFAFTEQGVAMLSGILNSDIAIDVNINIMRAFVQFRHFGLNFIDLKGKIDLMEQKYNRQFKIVFDALRELLAPPPDTKQTNNKLQ